MYKDNALVKGAAAARFRVHPIIAVILFIVMIILSELLSVPFILFFTQLSDQWSGLIGTTASATLTQLLAPFAPIILVIFLWVRFAEGRKISTLGFFKNQMGLEYLKGFGLGIGLMGLYVIAAYLLGVYSLQDTLFNFDAPLILLSTLVVLPGWLLQGAAEEIMTRGWLFQAASRKHILTGVILSSSIFGLLHLGNSGISPLAMINLILYGLFASVYALYTENLWSICAFHSAWNWSQGNLFGVSVSGTSILGGSVMVTGQTQGEAYMTGGTFGAEGSIIVTLILLTASAYFLYKTYKKPKIDEKKVA